MATIYFTNNADSGDGSLRAAISAAASGDSVTYSDSAFADTDEIVIPLSSVLVSPTTKDITIDGRGKRIVLDGQGVSLLLRAGTTNQSRVQNFINIDFINGYSDSYKAPVNITRVTAMFKGCRILGSTTVVTHAGICAEYEATFTMVDCLVSGCRRVGVGIGNSVSNEVIIKRCTIVGNVIDISINNTNTANSITDCLIHTKTGPGSADIITTLPSTCGFVAPCPDTIDPESWTNTLWQSWDFRLTPESPYLTGAETSEGEVDVLGNPRKANGAIGAYEGAWKVVDSSEETWTLTQNETVEYLDVRDRGCIKLAGYFLNVQEKAYLFSNASFDVTDGKYGYIGCNEVVEYGDFHEEIPEKVIIVQRGADVASVSVSNVVNRTANIEITKNGTGDYVVLAGQIGPENWARITIADGSFVIPTDRAFKVRVFDGDKLLDTQPNPRKYYFTGTTTGSFAEKTDWALDPEKTLVCNESPIVAGCTFICE